MSERTRHKIGCTRTVRTAVMVCAYLNARYRQESRFRYVFANPTEMNGWWSADIICDIFGDENIDKLFPNVVNECRAFIAGSGEVWT